MEKEYLTKEEARQIVREELEAHEERVREEEKKREAEKSKAEKVTRQEALRRIGKSESSLWHYNDTGYLIAHREKGGPSAVWYYEADVARVERERGIKKNGGKRHD